MDLTILIRSKLMLMRSGPYPLIGLGQIGFLLMGFCSTENSFIRYYLRDKLPQFMANSLASFGLIISEQAVAVPVTSVI